MLVRVFLPFIQSVGVEGAVGNFFANLIPTYININGSDVASVRDTEQELRSEMDDAFSALNTAIVTSAENLKDFRERQLRNLRLIFMLHRNKAVKSQSSKAQQTL